MRLEYKKFNMLCCFSKLVLFFLVAQTKWQFPIRHVTLGMNIKALQWSPNSTFSKTVENTPGLQPSFYYLSQSNIGLLLIFACVCFFVILHDGGSEWVTREARHNFPRPRMMFLCARKQLLVLTSFLTMKRGFHHRRNGRLFAHETKQRTAPPTKSIYHTLLRPPIMSFLPLLLLLIVIMSVVGKHGFVNSPSLSSLKQHDNNMRKRHFPRTTAARRASMMMMTMDAALVQQAWQRTIEQH